MTIIIDKTYL